MSILDLKTATFIQAHLLHLFMNGNTHSHTTCFCTLPDGWSLVLFGGRSSCSIEACDAEQVWSWSSIQKFLMFGARGLIRGRGAASQRGRRTLHTAGFQQACKTQIVSFLISGLSFPEVSLLSPKWKFLIIPSVIGMVSKLLLHLGMSKITYFHVIWTTRQVVSFREARQN